MAAQVQCARSSGPNCTRAPEAVPHAFERTRASPRPNEPEGMACLAIRSVRTNPGRCAQSERTRALQDLGVERTRGAEPAQVRSSALPSISCSIASTAALSGARSWLTIRQTRGSFTRGLVVAQDVAETSNRPPGNVLVLPKAAFRRVPTDASLRVGIAETGLPRQGAC
jgi:hypothetical protein